MSKERIHIETHFQQKVRLISRMSPSDKDFRFNNLMYLVNQESLRTCFSELDKDKTPGVDKVTYAQYEEDLEANIANLVERMKRMGYHPKPVKRTYIPKDNGKQRPLGLPSLEDKLVQQVLCHILSAIFEPNFEDFSYGFRPKRNCHQALARLNHAVMRSPVNYIIDADIKGYFDNVDHDSMRKCLEQRITDRKFLRYLMRFLKSGVMEEGK